MSSATESGQVPAMWAPNTLPQLSLLSVVRIGRNKSSDSTPTPPNHRMIYT